jgi:predicted transcriptional regulator
MWMILEIGDHLRRVKERLAHGTFGRWIEEEFGWTERTAQNYMRAAIEFSGQYEIISVLPPTTVYRLAAPSTPAPVREEIIERMEAGEPLTPAAIETMVSEAKEKAKLAKLTPEQKKRQISNKKREESCRKATEEQYAAQRAHLEAVAQEAVALIRDYVPEDQFTRLAKLVQDSGYRFTGALTEAAFKGVPSGSGDQPISAHFA